LATAPTLALIRLPETSLPETLTGMWRRIAVMYQLDALSMTGSSRTIGEYVRWLDRFFRQVADPAAVTTDQIVAFAYGPGASGQPPSPSTTNVRLAAVGGFYDFTTRSGRLAVNPAAAIEHAVGGPSPASGLSRARLRRLLGAIPETPAGIRDRAIIMTSALGGLRRAEVLDLAAADLTDGGTIVYRARVKAGSVQWLSLPEAAEAAIRRWMAIRAASPRLDPDDGRLFPVSRAAFAANLRRYARQARVGHVTPDMLRRSDLGRAAARPAFWYDELVGRWRRHDQPRPR
jgi:site-specific recombinase XerD